ncbi:LCP family protein [Rhodococcus aerolatus]
MDGWTQGGAPRNRAWSQAGDQGRGAPPPPRPAEQRPAGGRGWADGPRQSPPTQTWDRDGQDRTQYAPRQTPQPYRDGEPPRRGSGTRPRRRRPRWGRRIGIVLLVLVLLLGGFVAYLDSTLGRTDALGDYPGRVADTPGTNWLLVGSDSREGLDAQQQADLSTGSAQDAGGQRTDTIMVLHVPAGGGASTLVSIPRDSYLPIPGYGEDKVNAAFTLGGPTLLVQTVEEATGLHLDHYAEVGFGGFAGIVDAVGGVNLCLDQAIDDPLAGINLQPGCQDLTGPQALGFVRTRYTFANADLTRVQNQRKFLTALLDKATSPSTLLNPFRILPLATSATGSLTVDSGDHIWNLAGLAWAVRGDLVTTTVPVGGFEDTDAGNALLWDQAKASQFFGALAEDRQVPPDLITTG